jgi:transcriptional regulator with XRE-family HTH domain
MDDRQLGRLVRAVRLRLNWRQVDVAVRAGVSQSIVSDVELGRLEKVGLATIRSVAEVLEIRVTLNAQWRGGAGDRLLDRAHASIVEHMIGLLRDRDWEVIPEFTFNVYGDRGSVDILAWHPGDRILLIIEVKATLTDLQDLLASLSKKRRVVPGAARQAKGWRPDHVATLLVAAGTSLNRRVVARHAATFTIAFPTRGRDVDAWLRHPTGAMAGLSFVTGDAVATLNRESRSRVRLTSRDVPDAGHGRVTSTGDGDLGLARR